MKDVENSEIWIARRFTLCERVRINPVFFSSVFISLPSLIIFLPFVVFRWHLIVGFSIRMWFGLICCFIWIWLSPFFIYNYVQRINNTYSRAKKLNILSDSCEHLLTSANSQLGHIGKLNWIWILFILTLAILDITYINRFGFMGFSDPYLYIFLFVLAYIVYFTSIGIRGVIIVYQLITDLVHSKRIVLDFYNSDRMGGLRCMKELIFSASKLFATGILFFPILLDYILYTNNIGIKIALYFSIIIFTVLLIMTFFVPIKKLYNYANEFRDNHLDILGQKLECLASDLNNNKKNCSLNDAILIINYYQQINIISKVSIFNIASDTYIEIIGSILIPLLTFCFNFQDIIAVFRELAK